MTADTKAYYYISKTDDPFYNIALEDYFYTQCKIWDCVYFFWINRPSVFMGRYQTAEAETDTNYLEAQGIPTLRRISGGGTVYHDYGNLNFSSIKNDTMGRGFDLKSFPLPIVQAMAKQGVALEVSPRGDLRLDGLKVAGSAEATRARRMLYHLCILFDTDLEKLQRVLEVSPSIDVRSRVASVRSSVCNLKPSLPNVPNIESFRSLIVDTLAEGHSSLIELNERNIDHNYVAHIRAERYEKLEWINSPVGRIILKNQNNR